MKTLEQIVISTETAKSVMSYLNNRRRYRSEPMSIATLRKKMRQAGVKFDVGALHRMFKELELAGYGSLEYSRKHPVTFVWKKNFMQVAEEAVSFLDENGIRRPTAFVAVPRGLSRKDIEFLLQRASA